MHIIDVFRRKLDFPDLKREAIRLARLHKARAMVIENAASGQQLFQTLHREQHAGVPLPIKRQPEGDKISRMMGVSGMIEGGQLLLPREAPWLAEFKHELLSFPNGRHDDQVDALTQLMDWAFSPAASDNQICFGGIIVGENRLDHFL